MKSKFGYLYSFTLFAFLFSAQASAIASTSETVDNATLSKRGAQLSAICSACHGPGGNTANPTLYPNLAGQRPDYIVLQLTNFKSGERPNAVMKGIASSLQESDMQALGAYFGAQKAKHQPSTDVAMESKGRLIFTKGSTAGAPACQSCHGTQGQGQAVFPRIASQPSSYTLEQLHVYRDAAKFNNPLAMEMKAIALKVDEDEMRAVSAYLATLQ